MSDASSPPSPISAPSASGAFLLQYTLEVIYPYQIVATFGISFLLGVLLASYLSVSAPLLMVGVFLFTSLLLLKPKPIIKIVAVIGLGLFLGWWRYEAVINLPDNSINNWADRTIAVHGQVASDPEFIDGKQRLQLRISQAEKPEASGKLLLTTWPLPAYQYGDKLKGKIAISIPTVSDDFDYAAYLRKDGVHAVGDAIGEMILLEPASPCLLGYLYKAKHWLANKVNQLFPDPHNSLMNGLLLGLRTQLSDEFKEYLQYSGTTHIIALSGFNVTIIAGFFLYLLRRAPRKWGLILAGVGVLLFVLMTGASSSVVRAAVMGWLLLLAALWGRRRSIANAVIVAAMIMVAINPLILQHDVGFQLSVAATTGLIFLTPHFLRWLKFMPLIIKEISATTLGAILATLPLVVFHFGGFSSNALLANILVVPLVPITMFVGFAAVILFSVFPFLQFINLIVMGTTGLLIKIISFFGNLPHAFMEVPRLSPAWPVIYYLLLVILIYYLQNARVYKT